MKNPLLQGRNLCKAFPRDGENAMILNGINVDIYKGDFTVIMGASGAGKSTLLYSLSGMDRITSGEIIYNGETISRYPENRMAALRATEFGFVFQQAHLVSSLTLFENVAAAGYVGKVHPPKEVDQAAASLLEKMRVGSAKDRLPSQVSGGEAQRAAIARAVINHPGLVFADEPTGALNKASSGDVLDLLSDLNRSGQSILMVTHDIKAAIRGNRILYLEDGRILDEFSFPIYSPDAARDREAKASQWLTALQW